MSAATYRWRAKLLMRMVVALALPIFVSVSAPNFVAAQEDPTNARNLAEIELGQALGLIEIPDIGIDLVFVAGVGKQELKLGPGHYPGTPLPGQFGNAAIAGHRTTYGAPFSNLDLLKAGDEIVITYPSATYVYLVSSTSIVTPDEVSVIATKDSSKGSLTLTTCHPKGSSAQRLIISAEIDPNKSSPLGPATYYNGSSTSNDSTAPVLQATPASSTNASTNGATATGGSTQGSQETMSTSQANDQIVSGAPSGSDSAESNQTATVISSGVQLFVHSDEAPRAEPAESAPPILAADEPSNTPGVTAESTAGANESRDAFVSIVPLDADLPAGVLGIVWVLAIGLSVLFGVLLQQQFTSRILAWAFAALPITFALRGFTQLIEAAL